MSLINAYFSDMTYRYRPVVLSTYYKVASSEGGRRRRRRMRKGALAY